MTIRHIASSVITVILGIVGQGAVAASPQCGSSPQIDHFLLAVPDLKNGANSFEKQTGIRPVFGGVHTGGATANYLVRLDDCQYLEIIGPNPGRDTDNSLSKMFVTLSGPTLMGFAMSSTNLQAAASSFTHQGLAIGTFEENGRITPAGEQLAWKTIFLPKLFGPQLLSFFIDWRESKHPSIDLIGGIQLISFSLATPDANKIAEAFNALSLDLDIKESADSHLAITLSTPKGPVTYHSPK